MPKFYKQHLLTPPHLLEGPHQETEHIHHQAQAEMDEDFDYNPIKTLISWRALSRPYRKKDRSYYVTIAILLVLISLIAFFAGERLLIGALLALGFIVYVLNFVAPDDVDYKISTQGITIGDHFYHWQILDSFWIAEKDGFKLLYVLTSLRFPKMLIIPLGDIDIEHVKRACARFLPFHEVVPKSTFEKWSESLQKHFPLENTHK